MVHFRSFLSWDFEMGFHIASERFKSNLALEVGKYVYLC